MLFHRGIANQVLVQSCFFVLFAVGWRGGELIWGSCVRRFCGFGWRASGSTTFYVAMVVRKRLFSGVFDVKGQRLFIHSQNQYPPISTSSISKVNDKPGKLLLISLPMHSHTATCERFKKPSSNKLHFCWLRIRCFTWGDGAIFQMRWWDLRFLQLFPSLITEAVKRQWQKNQK